MIRELKQKDIDACLGLVQNGVAYDNLKTRILAFLQSENGYSFGDFNEEKLLGFVLFTGCSFDITISLFVVYQADEAVINNLVGKVREVANTFGAKAIYVNNHNLDKELLNSLEILEQYRLE